VGKREGKKPRGRHRRKWEYNIKIKPKRKGIDHRLDSPGPGDVKRRDIVNATTKCGEFRD
jgi:hypothetical protein